MGFEVLSIVLFAIKLQLIASQIFNPEVQSDSVSVSSHLGDLSSPGNSQVPPDQVESPRNFPANPLSSSSILQNFLNVKNQKPKPLRRRVPPTTPCKPKIQCKNASDLIIIFDDTTNVNRKDYFKMLDFIATVSGAWRSVLESHVALVHQSQHEYKGHLQEPPPVTLNATTGVSPLEMKALAYSRPYKPARLIPAMNSGDEEQKKVYNLDVALDEAANESRMAVHNHHTVKNVLLITSTNSSNWASTKAKMNQLNEIDRLTTYAIGIGQKDSVTQKQFETELKMFTNNVERNLKLIPNFDRLESMYTFVQRFC